MKVIYSIAGCAFAMSAFLVACADTEVGGVRNEDGTTGEFSYGRVEAEDVETDAITILARVLKYDYSDGENEIIPFAKVDENGEFVRSGAAIPVTKGESIAYSLGIGEACSDGGGLQIDNPDAEWAFAELISDAVSGEHYRLFGALRREAAIWRNTNGGNLIASGDVLADWYFVTAPANVAGRCEYEDGRALEAELHLETGWNLILRKIIEVDKSNDNETSIRSERLETYTEKSPSLTWYILEEPEWENE